MSISKREKTLIIIVLALAVVCVYYIFFLKPYMDQIGDLNIERTTKSIEVGSGEQTSGQIATLENQIAVLKDDIGAYSENIAQGFDQPPVLVYLEETVDKSAKKMMFAFGRIKQVGQMNICPVTVTMVSSYEGLKEILDELASETMVIRVTSLDVMRSEGAEDPADEDEVYDPSADPAETGGSDTQYQTLNDSLGVDDPLDVTLTLEIYSLGGEIPADTVYTFDEDNHMYGGDIFY